MSKLKRQLSSSLALVLQSKMQEKGRGLGKEEIARSQCMLQVSKKCQKELSYDNQCVINQKCSQVGLLLGEYFE